MVENTNLAQQQGECCASLLKHLRTKVVSGETQRDKKEYLKDFVDRWSILVYWWDDVILYTVFCIDLLSVTFILTAPSPRCIFFLLTVLER